MNTINQTLRLDAPVRGVKRNPVVMTTCDTAVRLPPGGSLAVTNLSRFTAELRAAALAGLRLAQQGLEQLEKVVEEYCVEFEPRVAMATVRIAR